jgi:hypothetical protein
MQAITDPRTQHQWAGAAIGIELGIAGDNPGAVGSCDDFAPQGIDHATGHAGTKPIEKDRLVDRDDIRFNRALARRGRRLCRGSMRQSTENKERGQRSGAAYVHEHALPERSHWFAIRNIGAD